MVSLLLLAFLFLAVWTVIILLKKDSRENEIKEVLNEMFSNTLKLFKNISELFNILREGKFHNENLDSNSSTDTALESPKLIQIKVKKEKDVV